MSGTLDQITDFTAITPTGDGISDILQVRLLRDTANTLGMSAGADPLTGDVHVVNLDAHIECDTPTGSESEYIK